MALLWTWGVFSTNPFVDFSTTWIEPLIQRAVDITHTIERDLLCTVVYFAVIGVAYLFHSPFRAHSTAATDTYGRLTKFFQTWSTVVFFCFHLGPQFFYSKQSQIQQARDENEAVPILYFPLFFTFNVLFAFLHKMKRRWGLGVTYGGRLSLIGLNSLILAAVGTMHYAYCSILYENSANRPLKAFLYSLTPAPVLLYPFRCMAKVVLLSCGFIALDYQYKKWHSFDPSRGILWSELYELHKRPRNATMASEKATSSEKEDWRELVAPPRVYAPTSLAATSTPRPLAQPGQSGLSSCAPSYRTTGQRSAITSDVPFREPAVSPIATTATMAIPSQAIASLRPRVLYHECPPDVNMDLLESWFDVDDAALKRVCGSSASTRLSLPLSLQQPPLSQPVSVASKRTSTQPAASSTPGPLGGFASTKIHDVDHADPAFSSLMSFRAPRFFIREAQEALHPVNRPGMVPWWSTFVLFTVWQTLAGATLRFLAFDVRTVQLFATPKIFHLHFSRSLKQCVANAAQCGSEWASSTVATGPPQPTTMPRSAAMAIAPGGRSSSTAQEEDEPDIWFDWIADVGDGFNPTYGMARLLAQPLLHLPFASARKKKRQLPMRGVGREESMRSDSDACSGDNTCSLYSTIQAAASAPTTPRCKGYSMSASPFLFPSAPFSPTAKMRPYARSVGGGGDIVGDHIRTARSEATPAQALPPPFASINTPSGNEEASESSEYDESQGGENNSSCTNVKNDSIHSKDVVSAFYVSRPPCRDRASTGVHRLKIAASRALLGVEKNGYATLPRGSFVVVGGDLAYPSPDDETYTTRLFEPYSDALSGNVRLQSVFHAEQHRIVVGDRHDVDAVHINMLDAETVVGLATGRGGLSVGRGTAEEALRTVPMLFAIPGNHDWFDGLTTYRKYILERTWIGGWLMPQRSSFFVLCLPCNWYMLCGDTGNTQDIDVSQRNYFLDVIERYMNAESCVILAAHEPGWLFDAMEREDKPRQPELNRVVEALGTRLRLRLAGDIHNYSRHVPTDPSSEAATLVVSGGGGAFLHGSRNDRVISQGTRYVRACAFPSRTTFTNMAARLWGFRVVNWKFDMVVGFLCFVILLSALPLPVETEVEGTTSSGPTAAPVTLAQVFSLWVAYTTGITSHVVAKGIISIFPILFFWMCFSSAGSDRHATLQWRLCYGAAWTFAVVLCCCGAMGFVHVQILYLMDNGFLYSAEGRWNSVMESQAKVIVSTFSTHAWQILGGQRLTVARTWGAFQNVISRAGLMQWLLVVLRCLDPFETFSFLSTKVSSGTMGVFTEDVSRLQILIYYVYVLFFYWIVITPVVSMLIGTFLLFSVTSFDYMYDATYSAFQIEDYKHFIRFRLDAKTRQLHAYVIAEQKPAKVYELDRKFLWSLTDSGLEEHRPPHLKQHPSRWAPMQNENRKKKPMTEVLEHFTVHPHRVSPPSEKLERSGCC